MHIGEKVPVFRATSIDRQGVRQLHSAELRGAWRVFTFLPQNYDGYDSRLGPCSQSFAEHAVQCIFIQAMSCPLMIQRVVATMPSSSLTLIDPLGRLHRRFGLRRLCAPKCRTFLIDPVGALRFQVVYDLGSPGLSVLVELLLAVREQNITICVSP